MIVVASVVVAVLVTAAALLFVAISTDFATGGLDAHEDHEVDR